MSHVWFVIRWLRLPAMALCVGGQMMLAAMSSRSGAWDTSS